MFYIDNYPYVVRIEIVSRVYFNEMSRVVSHIAFKENEFATYTIKEDGLLYLIFKPEVFIDYCAAQKVVADRIRLQQDTDYYVVCDTTGICGTNKAARDYLSGTGSEQVKAIAFVVSSRVGRSLLSLYLKYHHTPVKTAVFPSHELAIKHFTKFLILKIKKINA